MKVFWMIPAVFLLFALAVGMSHAEPDECIIIEHEQYWRERDTRHIMEQAYVIGNLQIRINELEVMLRLSKPQVYR